MKSTDKFLIGIVAGIVILVIVALVVTLAKPEATYQSDDTPEGAAYNYLLALQKGEEDVAWSYLSPDIRGYPGSLTDFIEDSEKHSWAVYPDRHSSLSIVEERIRGENANVTVRETWLRSGDLFSSGQSSRTFEMKLHIVQGEWKIVDSGAYWASCWNERGGCK